VVLANGSMSSAQSGEGEIRRAMVEGDVVDCITLQRHLPISLFISIGYGIFMSSVLTVFIATTP
jgi:hypothetical protein